MSEGHANSAIVHTNEAEFDAVVANAPLALVKLGAPWCPPCRMMGPYIELFARQYAGQALVVEVNSDETPALKERFEVNGIPHVVLLRNGQVADFFAGFSGDVEMRKRVRTMILGENAGDDLSQAELDFAAAALAAEEAFEAADALLHATPEHQAVQEAWKPQGEKYKAALEAANAELDAGTIDQSTHDQRVEAAQTEAQAFQQTDDFKALYAAYRAVAAASSGEKNYIAALTAAVDQFFPLAASTAPAATNDQTELDGAHTGAVCQLGDPSCQS